MALRVGAPVIGLNDSGGEFFRLLLLLFLI